MELKRTKDEEGLAHSYDDYPCMLNEGTGLLRWQHHGVFHRETGKSEYHLRGFEQDLVFTNYWDLYGCKLEGRMLLWQ